MENRHEAHYCIHSNVFLLDDTVSSFVVLGI